MVAFLARRLRRLAIAKAQPCEHRLADMNTAVVDDIGLHHLPAVGLLNTRNRTAEEVVSYVSQMEGLVGIGR